MELYITHNGFHVAFSSFLFSTLQGTMVGSFWDLPNLTWAGTKTYYLQDHYVKNPT
jgi:hypothetical protein